VHSGAEIAARIIYVVPHVGAASSLPDGVTNRVRALRFPSPVLHIARAAADDEKICCYVACRDGGVLGIAWTCMDAEEGRSQSPVSVTRHVAVRQLVCLDGGWLIAQGLLRGLVLHRRTLGREVPLTPPASAVITALSHFPKLGTFVGRCDGTVLWWSHDSATAFMGEGVPSPRVLELGQPVADVCPLLDAEGGVQGVTLVGSAGLLATYSSAASSSLSNAVEPLQKVFATSVLGANVKSICCALPGGQLALTLSGRVHVVQVAGKREDEHNKSDELGQDSTRCDEAVPQALILSDSVAAMEFLEPWSLIVLTHRGDLLELELSPPENDEQVAAPQSREAAQSSVKSLLLRLPQLASARAGLEAERARLCRSAKSLRKIAESLSTAGTLKASWVVRPSKTPEGLRRKHEILIVADLILPPMAVTEDIDDNDMVWVHRMEAASSSAARSASCPVARGARASRLVLPFTLDSPYPITARCWLDLQWRRGGGAPTVAPGVSLRAVGATFDVMDWPHGSGVVNLADIEAKASGKVHPSFRARTAFSDFTVMLLVDGETALASDVVAGLVGQAENARREEVLLNFSGGKCLADEIKARIRISKADDGHFVVQGQCAQTGLAAALRQAIACRALQRGWCVLPPSRLDRALYAFPPHELGCQWEEEQGGALQAAMKLYARLRR
jgi:hypothetical protein